ncbi:uncharacterized protein DUF2793 [Albidovulum inexpectatum]|uniref:Uncharacterized protein DUF2793 n=1 Tax=Albidovulum inexpectatum TaxID=196587 RepID=A0A2S5JEC6_9RHOB|nr:DUF2793 domain-containing protein [Albidovulum inexpectatum]PPB79750.1 uncharacterized protein DUF2793 [Albidovulum inexpectatum]
MSNTVNLLLPYLQAAQAQKHVTHNDALRLLDGIVQLSVVDRDLTAPPASPADGARYLVAPGATGAWAGWDGSIAYWVDGAWMRLPPRTGWRAWVEDEGVTIVYDGAAWNAATPSVGDLADVDLSGLADGDTIVWDATNLVWVPGQTGGVQGYDIRTGFFDAPDASELIDAIPVVRDILFPANFAGSVAFVATPPSQAFVLSVRDDGTEIGTVTISTAGAATFATTAGQPVTVASGSKLDFVAPSTADTAIAGLWITLKGEA